MPDKRNILCLSNPTWEGDYAKTIVELMTVAAETHHVLYVDYQFTIKDLLYAFLGRSNAPWKRMLGLENRLRKIELSEHHAVHVLTPPTILTINFLKDGWLYRRLLKFNSDIVARSIEKALAKLKMQQDLIVIDAFSPGMGLYNIGRFNEAAHFYHCYDEIGAADWFGVHGADLEREYMPKVDGVICTSRGLYNAKKPYNKNTFLVQNGVNFDLFSQGLRDNTSDEQKVIGYIGSIDDRLDYGLLEQLFKDYPEWAFHFVGRCNYDKGKQILNQYPNVTLLGSMPVTALPEVLATFHAGLIPFVKNDFTKGIYPLKINEYLAAGLPVVLTRFSDLSEFESTAAICDSPEDFSLALKREIEADTFGQRKQRVAIAQRNSWPGRWQEIENVIQKVETQKTMATATR